MITSAQSFVRLLRAPTDPPYSESRLKIQLSCLAWDDSDLYIPNKHELIAEFILNRFLKDKSKATDNPIIDTRYWHLLRKVLDASGGVGPARGLKVWLGSLLSRTPLAPIIISFFTLLRNLSATEAKRLLVLVRPCFSILWQSSVHKIGVESLLECFGSVLGLSGDLPSDEDYECMCGAILSSYREALGNTGNKKKLYLTFLQTHFSSWTRTVCLSSFYLSPHLNQAVYAAGAETIFSLDALRISPPSEGLFTTIAALSSPFPTNFDVSLLPRLFGTHTHFLRRYRTALFPASSNQVQTRENEMRVTSITFFASCLKLLAENAKSWDAKVGLVKIIECERIFHNRSVIEGEVEAVREEAVGVLEGESGEDVTCLALEVLVSLARIHYHLVEPVVGRVLCRLILAPSSMRKSVDEFLNLLLDFHSKTRTLNTYSQAFIAACASLPSLTSPASPQDLYSRARISTTVSCTHLSSIAQALRSFLTPAQVKEASCIFTTVRETYDHYQNLSSLIKTSEAEAEDRPIRKRRKCESALLPASSPMRDINAHALSLSLTFKFAALFLSNLPSSFVTADVRDVVRDAGVWAVEASRLLLCKKTKTSTISWADQVTGAALLRLGYHLQAWKCIGEKNDMRKLLEIVKVKVGIDDELVLEIVRFLFAWSSGSDRGTELEPVLDVALSYVEAQYPRFQGGLMILYLIVERWLDLIDAQASRTSIDRLVNLIFSLWSISICQTDLLGLQPKDVLWCVLRNAQFWEMGNIRVSVLGYLTSLTASLEKKSASDYFGRTYYLLLHVPPEYLTKQARVELARQAVERDVAICSALHANNRKECKELNNQEQAPQTLTHIRVFLQRLGQLGYLNTSDYDNAGGYVQHLMNTDILGNAVLREVTIDLVEVYIVALLRASEKDASASAACVSILRSIAQCGSLEKRSVPQVCMLQLVERITHEFSVSSFSNVMIASMKDLYAALTPTSQLNMSDMLPPSETVKAFAHHLSFGHWLGIEVALATSAYGQQTAVSLLKNRSNHRVSVDILRLLFEELRCLPNVDRRAHLELALGVYAFSTDVERESGVSNEVVSTGCKHLSINDFSYLLATIYEALECTQIPLVRCVRLVHAATILLNDAPQGTLKSVQVFFGQCLKLFIGNMRFFAGPAEMKVACLELVARQCSDRPAALCSVDTGTIHVLLSKFIGGSSTHDRTTTPAVFHSAVTILNALVRLRRDLVIHILPHLGMVLRDLVLCTRGLRDQLAAKQSRIVTDTLPSWISPSEPLSMSEARALSRLFTSLTTKSVPCTHMQVISEQKAESLSKAFAKHAAHVVTAYIDALNDPLCVMRADVKRELEPGMFSLCEMMGVHGRDAVMVSVLDTGGKSVMKALWKEYEKHRYVGKG